MFSTVAVLSVCLVLLSAAQSPYDILGVQRDASEREIKSKFKKLTRQLHPDAQPRDLPDADREKNRKRFMELSTAYETLTDPEKKRALDEGRHAVDRNYLRYNLFNDDFTGAQATSLEIRKVMQGAESAVVMFWSTNFPESIDAGLAFKKAAIKLDLSEMTVMSYKCDDDASICRDNQLRQVPAMIVFIGGEKHQYHGKYEASAIVDFCLRHRKGQGKAFSISPDVFETCPNPAKSIAHEFSPYFLATSKRCWAGSLTYDFVTFEFTPCYDCELESKLALSLLSNILPNLMMRRLDCSGSGNYEDFCHDLGLRRRDRAWTIAAVQRRCWYAMKRPYDFSNEVCEDLRVTPFDGKYQSWELVQFILGRKKSHALRLSSSDIAQLKSKETGYAVLFTQKRGDADTILRWNILSREINTMSPVVGRRGFPLKLATVFCELPDVCGAKVTKLPAVLLYGYGTKVKQLPPVEYTDLRSLRGLKRRILHDVEPLHLHVLTPSTYNTKVNGGLNKGRSWFILYNAGEWCPPCNQIRGHWKTVARIIQNSDKAKKLSVGVVECDEHRTLCQKLNLQNFPTMTFLTKGRSKIEYQGDRNAADMAEWATDMIDNRLVSMSGQELQQRYRAGETILVSFSAGAWCPPCTSLTPTFKKVAHKLTTIPVTSINCDNERWICESFGIDGYPTIALLQKQRSLHYEGEKRTGAIVAWAKKLL